MEREFSVYVVQIPDAYTVIINYGKEDNEDSFLTTREHVKVGDKVRIVKPGKEVTDPKTKKSLGFHDLTKIELEIVEMFEKFSVCKLVVRESTSTVTRVLSPMFLEKQTISYKELDVDAKSMLPVEELETEIHIGDPVIFV